MDIPGPAAEVESWHHKSPTPAAEHLASDATAAAVLDAFHRYRLNSVTDNGLQSTQALAVTAAAAARTRPAAKERNGTSATRKSGELPPFFSIIKSILFVVCELL